MQPRVFVTREIPAEGLDRIQEATQCLVWPKQMPPDYEALIKYSSGCNGVLSLLSDRIDAAFFDAVGPQLKVVSNFAVGYNNIDVAAAQARGIQVGNTPGVLTEATADIAVALLLAAARRVREGIENVSNRQWKTWEPTGFIGQDLTGKTLGIVGMGRIGRAVARRMRLGWDMKIVYTARSAKPEVDAELGSRKVEFDELLAKSDFVSIHTDLNEGTKHLFDSGALAQMKPSAVLVTTARGGIIDQAALADALQSKQIFAAGLDVTDPEPLASDSPLRTMPNCVIVPHIGSGTITSRNAMAEIAADNLLAGLEGRPLRHAVTQ